MAKKGDQRGNGVPNMHMSNRSIPRTPPARAARPASVPKRKGPPAIPRQHSPQRTAQIKRRRKRKMRLAFAGIGLLAAAVFIGLSLTVLFRIETFTVTGESRYGQQEIVSAAGIAQGENLFLSKRREAEAALLKKLPYLEQVSVSIRLPDTIQINVAEAAPAALLELDGQTLLISAKGKILDDVTGQALQGLPKISGLKIVSAELGTTVQYENKNAAATIQQLMAALADNGLDILGVTFTDALSITLDYQDRIDVVLGLPSNLEEKVKMAAYVIANKLDADDAGTLTLSTDASQANFKPAYDTPNIIIPPSHGVSSQAASASSKG